MYNYDRNTVLAAYRAEHPDDLAPTEQTLEEYDAGLFAAYESELQRQAQDLGISLDSFNRAMLVFFADRSTAKTARTRVRHACSYFGSVQPQPPV